MQLPEILSGVGRKVIDLERLPARSGLMRFSGFSPLEVKEIVEDQRPPFESLLSGRQLAEQLADLTRKGFEIILQNKPDPQWVINGRETVELIRQAALGIITPDTLPFFNRPSTETNNSVSRPSRRMSLAEAVLRAAIVPVAGITITGAFYGGAELLKAEASAPKDTYGPEITREQLEANPLFITAQDEVKDANGDVIIQRVILGGYITPGVRRPPSIYESKRNPVTGLFSDSFQLISRPPIGNAISMISSADGQTVTIGGEVTIRTGLTKLIISFDGGRTWNNDNLWKEPLPPLCGGVIDLKSITDRNSVGGLGNFEGCPASQFIMAIDPATRTATVQAANLTIQAVSFNIGSAPDLRVASINGTNIKMYSAGSLSLQEGFVEINMDYLTGIGTARNITQTLIAGQMNRLGQLQGTSVYTDAFGNPRLEGSNTTRQLIYDINPLNPLDSTSTQTYYGNWLNNRGIEKYADNSFAVQSFGSARDGMGNKTATLGGGYGLTDGGDRAAVFNRETMAFYDLMPNKDSWGIFQNGLLREKINNQKGYIVNMSLIGQAFIPDGGDAVYTDRGLGSFFKIYLPTVYKNY